MLAHRLALATHTANVDDMLRRLPARQFVRWGWFYAIERFGAERDNWHAALIAQTLAQAHGWTRKDGTPLQFEDYLFTFDGEVVPKKAPPKQSWREQKAAMKLFVDQYVAGRTQGRPKRK